MRRWRGLVPGLLLALLGCALEQARPITWLDRFQAAQTSLGPDGVILDVVVIERPVGDAYINQELWGCTDEQVVPLEHKALLAENGFRVGCVIGMTPGRLQALLTSERCCVKSQRQILPAGKSLTLDVGRVVSRMQYRVTLDGRTSTAALEQAQSLLVIVPTLTADGRTKLEITPQVQYGAKVPHWDPTADRRNWEIERRRCDQTYPDLAWEVTLAPNVYLVIGAAAADSPSSLGYQCFINEESEVHVQRLVVLRTNRSTAEPSAADPDQPAGSSGQALPLALQATWSSFRTNRP